MPESYDGVPEFSQLTKAIFPEEWLGGIWPKYKIFSNRAMERGFGGHPILLPRMIWPFPRRDVPMFYWNFSLCSSTFFIGACAGIYVGFRNKYITRDLDLKISQHIYFDADGLEVGGTWRDWIGWIAKDWFNVARVLRRTIPWAVGGGLLHCWTSYWYRILVQSTGQMVPMLCTCILMTVGDMELMINYRTIGNAVYLAVFYDFLRLHFLGGNSTFFSFYFVKRYLGNPFAFVMYPPAVWRYLTAENTYFNFN